MPASAFTRRRLTVLLSGAAAMSPHISRAQETSRPLRIIVPWPAGGGVDTFARVIQAPLGRQLGQTILIDNIGGGSGRVGTQAAARAQPDGYTVLLANDTFAATEALPLPGTVSVRASFAPVTLGVQGLDGTVQVLKGLNEGDTVVLYSQGALKPDARISVVEQLVPAGGAK